MGLFTFRQRWTLQVYENIYVTWPLYELQHKRVDSRFVTVIVKRNWWLFEEKNPMNKVNSNVSPKSRKKHVIDAFVKFWMNLIKIKRTINGDVNIKWTIVESREMVLGWNQDGLPGSYLQPPRKFFTNQTARASLRRNMNIRIPLFDLTSLRLN